MSEFRSERDLQVRTADEFRSERDLRVRHRDRVRAEEERIRMEFEEKIRLEQSLREKDEEVLDLRRRLHESEHVKRVVAQRIETDRQFMREMVDEVRETEPANPLDISEDTESDDDTSTTSDMSDLNTIDDYLHASTKQSIQEMSGDKRSVHASSKSATRQRGIKNVHGSSKSKTRQKEIESVEKKLEQMQRSLEVLKSDTQYSDIDRGRTLNADTYTLDSVGYTRSRVEKNLSKVRNENDDMISKSGHFETESQKLFKLQLEEKHREHLSNDYRRQLKEELKKKRAAEIELLAIMKKVDKQKQELNETRNRNEKIEAEIREQEKEDEALTKRLQILREQKSLMIANLEKERKVAITPKAIKQEQLDGNRDVVTNRTIVPTTSLKQEKRDSDRDVITQRTEVETTTKPDSAKVEKVPDAVHASTTDRSAKCDHQPAFRLGFPKIPEFNGKYFEQWKMEVTCLLESKLYPDYVITTAIRNSLKGQTRQILLTLQPTATSEDIVKKLQDIYGNINTGDKAAKEFYSAIQRDHESCSAWGVRLETLYQHAVQKGEVSDAKRNEKLKERFWRGLTSDKLKGSTRVSYESDDSFETLRRKARREEEDLPETKPRSSKEKANLSQQRNEGDKESILQEILDRIRGVETDLDRMKNEGDSYNRNQFRGGSRGRARGRGRGPRHNYGDRQRENRQSQERKDTQPRQSQDKTEDKEKKNSKN